MRRMRLCAGALTLGFVASLAAAFSVLGAAPALAHTTQNAGPYAITFGWMTEPCYVGEPNAVQVFVHQGSPTGAAVSSNVTLTVTVAAGGVTGTAQPLAAAFDPDTGLGDPAEYDAPLIPEAPGTYTFTVAGEVNSTKVSVSASSGDSTFDSANDPSKIEFPSPVQGPATLGNAITNLQAALATETAAANAAKASADAARKTASTARTLAIVAIAVAVVLGFGSFGVGRRRRGA
ncbi:MAG TPA: hypothetical protein VFW71_08430 [Actinomycetota bacterium]|nr:hypothetical protein [Actinomycetota bacterium]